MYKMQTNQKVGAIKVLPYGSGARLRVLLLHGSVILSVTSSVKCEH